MQISITKASWLLCCIFWNIFIPLNTQNYSPRIGHLHSLRTKDSLTVSFWRLFHVSSPSLPSVIWGATGLWEAFPSLYHCFNFPGSPHFSQQACSAPLLFRYCAQSLSSLPKGTLLTHHHLAYCQHKCHSAHAHVPVLLTACLPSGCLHSDIIIRLNLILCIYCLELLLNHSLVYWYWQAMRYFVQKCTAQTACP